MEIKGLKSDACVHYSGLTQAQPMGGNDFITSDQRGLLSPFCESWVSMSGANLTLPKMVMSLARTKDPFSQPTFLFLARSHSTCIVWIQPRQHSPMP